MRWGVVILTLLRIVDSLLRSAAIRSKIQEHERAELEKLESYLQTLLDDLRVVRAAAGGLPDDPNDKYRRD